MLRLIVLGRQPLTQTHPVGLGKPPHLQINFIGPFFRRG
ncbi:MAG: hypothetical protein N838_11585 [Thiohalocapsa sp. PB-PSB1]|nr:MAG: hypothetical protein N838_11585 [Thiohalocapsa sp. PB-PSB1]